jgi:DNA-binding transcriptional regulator GbsR (MarR family)
MKYSDVIKKNDYSILELLICEECFSSYGAMSTPDIIEKTNLSHVKVGQVLKNFIMFGFLAKGRKDGMKNTYYVTNDGLEHYKQQLQYEDEDIDKMIDDYNKKLEEKKIEGGK